MPRTMLCLMSGVAPYYAGVQAYSWAFCGNAMLPKLSLDGAERTGRPTCEGIWVISRPSDLYRKALATIPCLKVRTLCIDDVKLPLQLLS